MVIYNSIIPFKGYKAITILPFIFSRVKELDFKTLNHEKIHLRQQLEVLVVSFLLILACVFAFSLSFWWLLASILVFYVFYSVEYLVRLVLYGNTKEAYRNISFEQEAYLHENDADYLGKRKLFSWLDYLAKKSYEKR